MASRQTIVLIEDNPGDVRLLQEHLLKDRSGPEEFVSTSRPRVVACSPSTGSH